ILSVHVKQQKRLHPVTYNEDSGLIAANDIIAEIDAAKDTTAATLTVAECSKQTKNNYHQKCNLSTKFKIGVKQKPVGKSVENMIHKAMKKPEKNMIRNSRFKNYSKSGTLKKSEGDDAMAHRPRYDNFLKSGTAHSRSSKFSGATKINRSVTSATITKEEYLKKH
ncbi:hypothetical protein Bhyg_03266, partial [Pseudolycoriella hygida]